MPSKQHLNTINDAVTRLSDAGTYRHLFHQCNPGEPVPSVAEIKKIVELCRSVIFPGYYGYSSTDTSILHYHIGVNVEELFKLLSRQIHAGLCFLCDDDSDRRVRASEISAQFISQLPDLRAILATDVESTYNGDPAATNFGEVISCYPSIRAVVNHRIAHTLLSLGVPLIPRIIAELAHSETGIDIHPGATIGHHFTIDHGTGVVIGQTCIIGNNVKIYQGVTLGARSFPLDENGNPIKGNLRHPIIEDDVIIYSNATVLGRITIGRGAVIGGNVWLTHSVAPGQTILQT